MAAVEFDGVGKHWARAAEPTIAGVDLAIADGEFCVFVGPSGCGKSTLLRMIAGLESITRGEVRIGGRRVNDLPPARRGVAMVFQSYALYPHMTVAENMAFGLRVFGADRADIDRRVRRAADILQLTPLLDRLPRALSGGQRQRVAIGRAIVKEPEVFLFDEPLSNLDASLRVQTRLEIAKLHREIGRASTVYVTHDQVEAMTLADRIVLLRAGADVATHGSVAQSGTPMALYHRPRNRFAAGFIGSPRMNLVDGRLLRAGPGCAVVDVDGTAVPVAVDARRARAGDAVAIGIRPEHVEPVSGDAAPGAAAGEDRDGDDDAATSATLRRVLQQVERLGDSTLLHLRGGGAAAPLMTVRVDGSADVATGTALGLRLHADRCHLFDASGVAFERTVRLPG